jgi:hypothetical protein
MVPLRGIFEALGAEVKWHSLTQTISAKRGTTEVELTVGDQKASVDRKTIILDVPPTMIKERVMVPLRFIAEALGSDVKWHGATQTIEITDNQSTNNTNTTDQTVRITEFTHNAIQPLNLGETLIFRLTGTPGGTAQVTVPGIARKINMREDSPGSYTAGYPLSKKNAVTNKVPTATLRLGNTTIQATAAYAILINIPVWGQSPTPTPYGGQSNTTSLSRPVINSPANGTSVTAPIYVAGTGAPNTTVVLSIASVTNSGQNGGTIEKRVQTDTQGNFRTTINPRNTNSQTNHVIRAYQLNSSNRHSPTATVQVYQQ